MRFRTKQRPRGALRPGDQRRLAALIAGVGVIMLCFSVVRRPQFWQRMFPDTSAQTEGVSKGPIPTSGTWLNDDVANSSGIQHDEFLAGAPSLDQDATSAVVSVTTNRLPLDVAESEFSSGVPRVPKDLLKTVKDDVIGVYSTESKAYYATLKMATLIEKKNSSTLPSGAFALFMDSP
ncbi:MAG: hypothetical protein GY826_13940, partial [Fuerstiella sp.]|nr:hypothetical protein [Fuerstiella sp.]